MHAAKLDKSDRLQRVYKFLCDNQWHSTREIDRGADVCAVNSIASELRRNGKNIVCKQVGRLFFYRLED